MLIGNYLNVLAAFWSLIFSMRRLFGLMFSFVGVLFALFALIASFDDCLGFKFEDFRFGGGSLDDRMFG